MPETAHHRCAHDAVTPIGMSQTHQSRKVDDALSALVDSFLPHAAKQDDDRDKKLAQGIRVAKDIIERFVSK